LKSIAIGAGGGGVS